MTSSSAAESMLAGTRPKVMRASAKAVESAVSVTADVLAMAAKTICPLALVATTGTRASPVPAATLSALPQRALPAGVASVVSAAVPAAGTLVSATMLAAAGTPLPLAPPPPPPPPQPASESGSSAQSPSAAERLRHALCRWTLDRATLVRVSTGDTIKRLRISATVRANVEVRGLAVWRITLLRR